MGLIVSLILYVFQVALLVLLFLMSAIAQTYYIIEALIITALNRNRK